MKKFFSSAKRKTLAHVPRQTTLLTALALLLFVSAPSQAQQAAQSVSGPAAAQFWQVLEHMPYAAKNTGPVLYVLSYSTRGNCIAFRNDWDHRLKSVQVRELFAPIAASQHFQNECADLALTRDPAVADAYYSHSRTAPPVNSSRERMEALQQMEEGFTQINNFLSRIGHIRDGYHTFIFRSSDSKQVLIYSGYSKTDMPRIFHEAFGAGAD